MNTENENPRPYPDHVSGTFMDKSQIPQHILDKMKEDRDKARAVKSENEKAQSAGYSDEELKDYIYELKCIIRKLLFHPLEGNEHFRNNVTEEVKRQTVNEYIKEQIDLDIF